MLKDLSNKIVLGSRKEFKVAVFLVFSHILMAVYFRLGSLMVNDGPHRVRKLAPQGIFN